MQFTDDLHIDWSWARFDLHDQVWTIEPEGSSAREDIDPAIRARRRDLGEEALCPEDSRHEIREAVTGELLSDERLNLVTAEALEIEHRLG